MMVAAVHQRDLDRRAGEAEHGFEPAETGADDHHAMGFVRRRRHGITTSLQFCCDVTLCSHSQLRSKALFEALFNAHCQSVDSESLLRCRQAFCVAGALATCLRAGRNSPASAPSRDNNAAPSIAEANPVLKPAAEPMPPVPENTATRSATPNMPPRKRPMLNTPDALPISTGLTELNTAF